MKIKRIYLVVLCLYVSGCISTERGVTTSSDYTVKNVFYSEAMPKLKLKISDEFEYLGSNKTKNRENFVEGSGSYTHRAESYAFAVFNEKSVDRMVLITLHHMNRGYWLPDMFGNVEHKIEHDIIKILDKSYHSCIWASREKKGKWVDNIEDKGFFTYKTGLIKSFARRVGLDNRRSIYIAYVENLQRCENGIYDDPKSWKNPSVLLESQREFIKNFKERAGMAIEFLPY